MRVGSIVHFEEVKKELPSMIIPKPNTNYTVRQIITKFGEIARNGQITARVIEDSVYIEELVNTKNSVGFTILVEEPYYMINFKEVLPPIENIEEHINENTLTPVLI